MYERHAKKEGWGPTQKGVAVADERRSGEMTNLVPLVLAKVHGGCTSLDTSTVDENMNLAAHDVQCALKDGFDVGHVREVCVDDLGPRQLG